MPSEVKPEALRATMSRFPTAVTVVSAIGPAGPAGATANAVASLSLEPPSLLISIRKQSPVLQAIAAARAFTVHLLGEDQSHEANVFAGRLGSAPRASLVGWRHHDDGTPRLERAIVHVDCTVAKLIPVFSHMLVVGTATAVELDNDRRPLVYFDGAFYGLKIG